LNKVTTANNEFALALYREIASEKDTNLVVSPLSIATAFAMVEAGANGETLAEMKTGLRHENLTDAEVRSGYRALMDRFTKDTSGYTLNMASRLWGEQSMNFLPEYLAVTAD